MGDALTQQTVLPVPGMACSSGGRGSVPKASGIRPGTSPAGARQLPWMGPWSWAPPASWLASQRTQGAPLSSPSSFPRGQIL